jgi:hypothetical protein
MFSSLKINLKLLCEITHLSAYDQNTWIEKRLNNLIHDDDNDDKGKFNSLGTAIKKLKEINYFSHFLPKKDYISYFRLTPST